MKKRRRNPTGTLLINAGKRGKRSGKRAKKSKRVLSIQSLLSRVSNPRKHKRRGKSGRFVKNPRKRHSRRASRRGRRNPIAIQNPRGRRGRHKMRGRRRNPISIQNPRRGRKGRGRRRNPSGVLGKVHNMGTGLLGGIRRMLAKIPLVGGILAGAVGTLGSAVGGALGVLPTHYAMKYIGGYIPPMLKPFGFTISGSILSAVIRALPVSLPYKAMLANGMVFAGGAVDAYRKLHGKEMDLGEDYDDAYSGADDFADGDDLGNDGSPLAAVEFADASLNDADYCGDDLSDAEIAAADLGRANYRRQFRKQGRQGESGAGRPGERWGWLIYAIGFDQFQQLSRMPREQRMDWIKRYKEHSRMLALQMLQQGMEPNVATAETHGLLVAA